MGKSFKNNIFILAIFVLQWLIFLTCKKSYKGEKVDKNPYVILFWHGRLALMPFAFKKFGLKGKKAYVVISHHKDGELIANIIKLYGLNTIRGSSSKGGVEVLKNAFKVLDEKDDVVITPDGPRGPCHFISDGAILIAQKKDVKIRILNYEASSFWEFKSWDKMILPKPFSKINYSFSQPIDISNLDKEKARKILKNEFDKILKFDNFKEC